MINKFLLGKLPKIKAHLNVKIIWNAGKCYVRYKRHKDSANRVYTELYDGYMKLEEDDI